MEATECVNSSEILSYAEMIDKYGPITVIIGVFIVILLITFTIIIKMMHNSNKQIMDQQKVMLDKLLKNDKKTEKNILEIFVKIDENVRSTLNDIKEELHTDRIAIYTFHNGVYSSHGLPFFKTSCVSEVVKKGSGITKKGQEHKDMNLCMFDDSIVTLYHNGCLIMEKVQNYKDEYPVLYNTFEKENIVSAVGVAIYDDDNNILGVLIAEFVTDKSHIIEKISMRLKQFAKSLSPILNYADYQNK